MSPMKRSVVTPMTFESIDWEEIERQEREEQEDE